MNLRLVAIAQFCGELKSINFHFAMRRPVKEDKYVEKGLLTFHTFKPSGLSRRSKKVIIFLQKVVKL